MQRFCTNCGNKLKGSERFCTKCGTAVDLYTGSAVYIASKKKSPKLMRSIIIICVVLAFCCAGVFAANVATGGVLMGDNRVLLKTASKIAKTENCRFKSTTTFSGTFTDDGDSESESLSYITEGAISYEDKIVHITDFSVMTGISDMLEKETIDAYVQFSDDLVDVYINDDGEWQKGQMDIGEYKAMLDNDNIKSTKFLRDVLQDKKVEKTDFQGTEVYEITASVSVDECSEIFFEENSDVLDEIVDELGISDTIAKDELANLFADLPNIAMKAYVDRKTNLPIRIELDYTETVNSLLDNFFELMIKYDEMDINLSVSECKTTMDFMDYNQTDVTIPQEAYNGENVGIIN